MKPSTIPVTCVLALTGMLAAGVSHWWSVRQFTGMLANGIPAVQATEHSPSVIPKAAATASGSKAIKPNSVASNLPESSDQKAFYEALIDKMQRVESQNRDLLDQLAETNRDLMKLEFRVDTHSESFRPLPVVEETPFSSIDNNAGVLPPRAEPISLPSYE